MNNQNDISAQSSGEDKKPAAKAEKKHTSWLADHRSLIWIAVTVLLTMWFLLKPPGADRRYDYQVLLVSAEYFDADVVTGLEQVFSGADVQTEGDRPAAVKIRPVQMVLDPEDPGAMQNSPASIKAVQADLEGGVSGLFLVDDPEAFRQLARGLGKTVEEPFVPCAEIPGLSIPQLDGMYLAGRWDVRSGEGYQALFEALTR